MDQRWIVNAVTSHKTHHMHKMHFKAIALCSVNSKTHTIQHEKQKIKRGQTKTGRKNPRDNAKKNYYMERNQIPSFVAKAILLM